MLSKAIELIPKKQSDMSKYTTLTEKFDVDKSETHYFTADHHVTQDSYDELNGTENRDLTVIMSAGVSSDSEAKRANSRQDAKKKMNKSTAKKKEKHIAE